jgi:hypothetical protein
MNSIVPKHLHDNTENSFQILHDELLRIGQAVRGSCPGEHPVKMQLGRITSDFTRLATLLGHFDLAQSFMLRAGQPRDWKLDGGVK